MKLVLAADLHAHLYQEFAVEDGEYVNSRLRQIVECLDWIKGVCLERGVSHLVVAGDLFHSRVGVPTPVLSLITERLVKFYPIKVILLAGNHDQWNSSFTSLDPLSGMATVVKSPTVADLLGGKVLFLPYRDDAEMASLVEEYSGAYDLVIGHLGVVGARLFSIVYQSRDGVSASQLEECFPEASVFLGHFHIPQTLSPRVSYVGAPLQHSFADREIIPRILVWEDGEVTAIENTTAPRFVVLDYEREGVENLNDHDYFWVTGDNLREMEQALLRLKIPRHRVRLSLREKEGTATERIISPQGMDYVQMVRQYAQATAADTRVVEFGERVVKDVVAAWQ